MAKYFHVELKVNHVQGTSREEIKTKVQCCLATNKLLPLVQDSIKVVSRSQGGAKSKGAGKDYELRVAKALTSWWGGKPFRRTPNSGGWDKQVGDGEIAAAGDIIAPHGSTFPFCVECKHRKEAINFFAESTGESDSSTLVDWWKQCERDAATVCKVPLLIFQCGRIEYVGYRAIEIQSLFEPIITDTKRRIKILTGGDYLFTTMLFEDFVTVYKPKVNKDQAGLVRPAIC
jgi:hypothetical protein